MNVKSSSTIFDLTWILVLGNWACALFVLGWFEPLMVVINSALLVLAGIFTIVTFYVLQKADKRGIKRERSSYELWRYLISLANVTAMAAAGWYFLAIGFSVMVLIHLSIRTSVKKVQK